MALTYEELIPVLVGDRLIGLNPKEEGERFYDYTELRFEHCVQLVYGKMIAILQEHDGEQKVMVAYSSELELDVGGANYPEFTELGGCDERILELAVLEEYLLVLGQESWWFSTWGHPLERIPSRAREHPTRLYRFSMQEHPMRTLTVTTDLDQLLALLPMLNLDNTHNPTVMLTPCGWLPRKTVQVSSSSEVICALTQHGQLYRRVKGVWELLTGQPVLWEDWQERGRPSNKTTAPFPELKQLSCSWGEMYTEAIDKHGQLLSISLNCYYPVNRAADEEKKVRSGILIKRVTGVPPVVAGLNEATNDPYATISVDYQNVIWSCAGTRTMSWSGWEERIMLAGPRQTGTRSSQY